jgi:hypothetical protein
MVSVVRRKESEESSKDALDVRSKVGPGCSKGFLDVDDHQLSCGGVEGKAREDVRGGAVDAWEGDKWVTPGLCGVARWTPGRVISR